MKLMEVNNKVANLCCFININRSDSGLDALYLFDFEANLSHPKM